MSNADTPRRPAGIRDVARRAGVSASTVSRCMRGGANVAPATRERVMRAASELAYVPSPAASRLASGRTETIAVIVPFATRWFFSEVISGAEHALRAAGYDLLLYNVGDAESRAAFFTDMPLRRRVDAALTVSSSLSSAEESALLALRVPVSSVGLHGAVFPRVGIDDEQSAATAVRHLVLLGHRKIAMISGDPDDPIGKATTMARRAGFIKAVRDAGLANCAEWIEAAPWGVTGGMHAMERLLSRTELPTAAFVESDEMAFGALQTLRRAGLTVPADISIVGFDDHEMAQATDLTTIAQPVRQQGELAAQRLLDVLAGRIPIPADTVLPTRLVVRGTTARPRALVNS